MNINFRFNAPLQRVMGPDIRLETEGPLLSRLVASITEPLTAQGSLLMRNVNMDDIRFRLMRAGFPMGITARKFILFKWTMVVILAFLFSVAAPELANMVSLPTVAIALPSTIFGAFYGWKLPDVWLSMRVRSRQAQIQLVMPDMIDLMTVSVEAGLGLYAAIARISERFPNALSEEFLRALQEVRLGRTNAQALRDLGQRVDLNELSTLIAALIQAEVLGISVANVLRVQSERLRDIRAQRAREQAQKAPLKMMFPLVFFIFPALFIVILGPAAIKVMQNPF